MTKGSVRTGFRIPERIGGYSITKILSDSGRAGMTGFIICHFFLLPFAFLLD
jgi:hypothetical protein